MALSSQKPNRTMLSSDLLTGLIAAVVLER
jgi:hypothetical protein